MQRTAAARSAPLSFAQQLQAAEVQSRHSQASADDSDLSDTESADWAAAYAPRSFKASFYASTTSTSPPKGRASYALLATSPAPAGPDMLAEEAGHGRHGNSGAVESLAHGASGSGGGGKKGNKKKGGKQLLFATGGGRQSLR